MPTGRGMGQEPVELIVGGVHVWRFAGGRVIPVIAGAESSSAPAGDSGAKTGTSDGKGTTDKSSAGAGQEDGEEFDKERAMATIRKLRESEKAGKAALKELETIRAEKAATDEAALKKQGDWQKLHEQEKKRADDLEPFKAKAERSEAALKKMLENERKDLPKHIITLLDKMDPAEQLEYIAENREALVPAKATPPNVNAKDGQTGSGTEGMTDAQKRELAAIYGVKAEYIR